MNKIVVKKTNKEINLEINLPGSKSITLRDYTLATLAEGESKILFPADCDDADRMKEALEIFGATFCKIKNGYRIKGVKEKLLQGDKKIWLGESGVSARLLLAISSLRNGQTFFDGKKTLRKRPQKYLLDCLSFLGAKIKSTNNGYLPISVIGGSINKTKVEMKGNTSSQYFTALMQIAPLLQKGLEIEVFGDLVSKPYIDITINEMAKFGAKVQNEKYKKIKINNQNYQATNLTVEGDASSASYFMALALIHGGRVKFNNLGKDSIQGDLNFYKICKQFGAKINLKKTEMEIIGPKNKKLNSISKLNLENMPDTAQTLMAIAPLIPGGIYLTGLSTLKLKECDRISSPANELRKLGVEVDEGIDWIKIKEKKNFVNTNFKKISINTYNDHRMAMSFAVLGTKLGNLTINNPDCVKKTFPNFWKILNKIY